MGGGGGPVDTIAQVRAHFDVHLNRGCPSGGTQGPHNDAMLSYILDLAFQVLIDNLERIFQRFLRAPLKINNGE